MAWLPGWAYRKPVTLSRASGAVTNYQMKLLVGESAGAVGEDVDCNSHVLSTFNDLRFTKSDGTTLLDYWIESITGATPNRLATGWQEFDSIGTGATPFYMYYGKADAPAVSSGANTFIVFDDFERGNNGDAVGGSWTVVTGSPIISTEQAFGGTRSCKMPASADMNIGQALSNNIAIRYRIYKADAATINLTTSNGTKGMQVRAKDDEYVDFYNGAAYTSVGLYLTHSIWQILEIVDIVLGTSLDIWVNDVKRADNGACNWSTNQATNVLRFNLGTDGIVYLENVIVRNYRTTEPAWGAWGAEETAPTGDTGAFFQLF